MRAFRRKLRHITGEWERECKRAEVNPLGVFIATYVSEGGVRFESVANTPWIRCYFDEVPLILDKKMEDYL